MRRPTPRTGLSAALTLAALFLAAAGQAATWTNVALIDSNCSARMKDKVDTHTRACALKCAAGGYGVWTADGKFVKFDEAGNAKAKALLEASDKSDKLRVDVEGELDGETLKVATLAWAK